MTTSQKAPKKVIPIVTDPTQHKIYPRSISGYFNNWRWAMVWLTQLFFYGMPWLQIGERQALLFDIAAHKFYIFGLVLYPQDLIYLAVILIISALALFLFTAVAGRLWCGFACPQTVYTKIFLWIEHQVEGDRAHRIKLDSRQFGFKTLYTKALKHALWIGFSIWTGFTFVGFFTPIRELFASSMQFNLGPWDLFWILFYGLATYANAGFLREQVCKHMCPYARFQSVMFDQDTLIVTYDEKRGEPRNGRSRNVDAKAEGLGDCIDCSFCVQVCPVGIDIRNGLQYECISCGLCIDACNQVMDKMEYPRGLIRFSTLSGAEAGVSRPELIQKIMRPRVLVYIGILVFICIAFALSLSQRASFKVDINRDRGVMSRYTPDGGIENVYQLQITNVTEQPASYRVRVAGLPELRVTSEQSFTVDAASEQKFVLTLQMPAKHAIDGTHGIVFEVESLTSHEQLSEKSIFLVAKD